jgi:hypothetical protein
MPQLKARQFPLYAGCPTLAASLFLRLGWDSDHANALSARQFPLYALRRYFLAVSAREVLGPLSMAA